MKISKTNYSNSCQVFLLFVLLLDFLILNHVGMYRHPQGQRCKIALELKLQIVVNFVTCVLPQLQKN